MKYRDAVHELKIRVAGVAVIVLTSLGAKYLGRIALSVFVRLIKSRSANAVAQLEKMGGLNG